MFVRNYLQARDLSIQKTIATGQNCYASLYYFINTNPRAIIPLEYYFGCRTLEASRIPKYIENNIKHDPNLLKLPPRNEDAVILFPYGTEDCRYIAMMIQDKKPILEVWFVEKVGNSKIAILKEQYPDNVSFTHIILDISKKCDQLWP